MVVFVVDPLDEWSAVARQNEWLPAEGACAKPRCCIEEAGRIIGGVQGGGCVGASLRCNKTLEVDTILTGALLAKVRVPAGLQPRAHRIFKAHYA